MLQFNQKPREFPGAICETNETNEQSVKKRFATELEHFHTQKTDYCLEKRKEKLNKDFF